MPALLCCRILHLTCHDDLNITGKGIQQVMMESYHYLLMEYMWGWHLFIAVDDQCPATCTCKCFLLLLVIEIVMVVVVVLITLGLLVRNPLQGW